MLNLLSQVSPLRYQLRIWGMEAPPQADLGGVDHWPRTPALHPRALAWPPHLLPCLRIDDCFRVKVKGSFLILQEKAGMNQKGDYSGLPGSHRIWGGSSSEDPGQEGPVRGQRLPLTALQSQGASVPPRDVGLGQVLFKRPTPCQDTPPGAAQISGVVLSVGVT